MDGNSFGALSALLGSLVGASASLATTWVGQKYSDRQERRREAVSKRERLYGTFIKECTRLQLDSYDHSLEDLSGGVRMIAALNRIRLVASTDVLDAAEKAVATILESYSAPNLSIAELRAQDAFRTRDALKDFCYACRQELAAF